MDYHKHELESIAAQLRLLAKEGHGGSEARLVVALDHASRRLREIAVDGPKRGSRRPKRWFANLKLLVLARLLYNWLLGNEP